MRRRSLVLGDKGSAVVALQVALIMGNFMGTRRNAISGCFDDATILGIEAFQFRLKSQADVGYSQVDGIANEKFLKLLGSYLHVDFMSLPDECWPNQPVPVEDVPCFDCGGIMTMDVSHEHGRNEKGEAIRCRICINCKSSLGHS